MNKLYKPTYGKLTKEDYDARREESGKQIERWRNEPPRTPKEREQDHIFALKILDDPVIAKVMQDTYDRATANQTEEEKAEENRFVEAMLEREEQERLDALIDDDLGKAA